MSKSNDFETDFLRLIFNGTTIPGIAENASTSPVTSLYVSLHTSSPGEAGNQTTNEVAYPEYSRVAVVRTAGGWTVSGNSVSPNASIEFPEQLTGGGGTATYAAIGTHASSTGKILFYGQISPSISYSIGTKPIIRSTSTITED